jgi:hypothetical protein
LTPLSNNDEAHLNEDINIFCTIPIYCIDNTNYLCNHECQYVFTGNICAEQHYTMIYCTHLYTNTTNLILPNVHSRLACQDIQPIGEANVDSSKLGKKTQGNTGSGLADKNTSLGKRPMGEEETG